MSKHSLCMLILLALFFFILSFENAADLPDDFIRVADFAVCYAFYLWYRADARSAADRGTFQGVVDIGLFMMQVGFLIIPYHLVKTRKRRGWMAIMISVVVVFLASVAGMLLGKY